MDKEIYILNDFSRNINKEVYIIDDLYANRDPRLYTECPTLRSERFGLKVLEDITNLTN